MAFTQITGTNVSIAPGVNGVSVTYTATNTGNTSMTIYESVSVTDSSQTTFLETVPTSFILAMGASTTRTITFNKVNVQLLLSNGTYSLVINLGSANALGQADYAQTGISNAFTVSTLISATITNPSVAATTT